MPSSRSERSEEPVRRRFFVVVLAWAVGAVGVALGGVWLVAKGPVVLPAMFAPEPLASGPLASGPHSEDPAVSGRGFTSLARALEGLDAQTLRAYFERYSSPSSMATVAPGSPLWIDVGALARLHPAWQLADSIESGQIDVPAAREMASSRLFASDIAMGLRAEQRGKQSAPRASVSENASGDISVLTTRERPARELEAEVSLDRLQQQEQAELREFLRDLEARHRERMASEEAFARSVLEDEVALSMRQVADEIPLAPVEADLALELTNLRLQLLERLAVPPTEREAAREEIARIRERLVEIWAEQTRRQERALRIALEEVPTRLRDEGEARLEAELRALSERNRALRAELRAEFDALLERDFSTSGERESTVLRLLLPAATEPVVRLAPLEASPRPGRSSNGATSVLPRNFEPEVAFLPSALSFSRTQTRDLVSNGARSTRIAALRARARQDALIWAQGAAARLGGTWSRNRTIRGREVPDLTAQALRLLFSTGEE